MSTNISSIACRIDLSYLARIRKEMPLWDQRRPEVYEQAGKGHLNGA